MKAGAWILATVLMASPAAATSKSIVVTFAAGSLAGSNTPVLVDLDFGANLDPNSIRVSCRGRDVPVQISESLWTSAKGTLAWVAADPKERAYIVHFDTLDRGRKPFRDYRPPIGVGDNFFYNRPGGFDPLGVGMTNDQPIAVDWDGDGKTDLLQRNLYSHAYGEPYWGLFFWRNIGTNAAPRFDHYLRIEVDGRPTDDRYACYALMDWDADGYTDILASTNRSLRVLRNTGRRDRLRLPVLTEDSSLPAVHPGGPNYGFRLLDWTGGMRPDLYTLDLTVSYRPVQELRSAWFRHPRLADAAGQPRFGPPEPVILNGSARYPEWPNDFYDWNGDGRPDAIGWAADLKSNPPEPGLVFWENTGTSQEPRFDGPPRRGLNTLGGIPTVARTPAFTGLLVPEMGSWLRYFEQDPARRAAPFNDRGLLMARGQPCSSGGFNSAEVADWEGDGDLDFIAGNEYGFVNLIENISRGSRTMFATVRQVLFVDGTPMRAVRWQFLNDGDPEWHLGQSKPTYVDWDGDGDRDLLVGNNTNRIAYFENTGSRVHPRFAPMRPLRHDGGEHFSFRRRPAAVDWDGDGLMGLVAAYGGTRDKVDPTSREPVCLFRRYRDANGKLRLKPGEPLRMADGTKFALTIPYMSGFEVADWDCDGDYDVFTNEKGSLLVYLNEGDNANPRFRRQVLQLFGRPIRIGHHETSLKAVDWDRDGAVDLVAGGESGWIYFFRRAALEATQPPGYTVSKSPYAQ